MGKHRVLQVGGVGGGRKLTRGKQDKRGDCDKNKKNLHRKELAPIDKERAFVYVFK